MDGEKNWEIGVLGLWSPKEKPHPARGGVLRLILAHSIISTKGAGCN